tara:strand:+ start:267 stop:572 length:306 start_codon:yes stop_codon:yes gene_type:complete
MEVTMRIKNKVDQFLNVSAEIKQLQKKQKELREFLLEAMDDHDVTFLAGKNGEGVVKAESIRWTLDTKAVREEMGDVWADQRSNMTPVVSLRVSTGIKQAA